MVRLLSALTVLLFSLPAAASARLDIKYLHQQKELSCEAAALAMVLQYYGVSVDEAEVVRKMPFDLTVHRGDVWGDPDSGFVGDIDGKMAETGYGIYWKPMARLASNWKKASVIEKGSVSELVSEIDHQRPVIAWGVDGPKKDLTWKTPAGRTVFAVTGEHVRVVYGYTGDRKAPTALLVMDPQHGPTEWKTQDFLANWDCFGRKGIVLYR
jgi:uncharacterized protein YvpB